MWRAAFHTGFVPLRGTLRLPLSQLDCAGSSFEGSSTRRYPDGFFVDLEFAPGHEIATSTVAASTAATATQGWGAVCSALSQRLAPPAPTCPLLLHPQGVSAVAPRSRCEDGVSIAGLLPLPVRIAFRALQDESRPCVWPLAKMTALRPAAGDEEEQQTIACDTEHLLT